MSNEPKPPFGQRLLWQLNVRDCRYPTADIGPGQSERHRFCGRPRIDNYPYCAQHALAAYNFSVRSEGERRRLQRLCEAVDEAEAA
jgi:hypothetical protein